MLKGMGMSAGMGVAGGMGGKRGVGGGVAGMALNGPRVLAAIFVVYGLVAVPVMAFLVPPFCNADEAAHFLRADQLAAGRVVATHPGGLADPGIAQVSAGFDAVRGHAEVKVRRAMLDNARQTAWGRRGEIGFPNTAVYPPSGYIPAAAAILAGRQLGWSIVATLDGARLLNGAVCIAVCAAAIALAGGTAALLFTILSLPMTLALFATVSQDGVLIGASALAVALVARRTRGAGAWVLCACLIVAAMGRPPYLAMVIVVLAMTAWRWRARLAAACVVAGAVLAWDIGCAGPVAAATWRGPGIDPAGQIASVASHPALLWRVAVVVAAHQWADGLPYARQFVGVLGWLDVSLPTAYYAAAWGVIALALALAWPAERSARMAAAVGAAILVSGAGIFAVQYLTWTVVGSRLVEGVQGRYFLPIALFLPLMLPGPGKAWAGAWGGGLHGGAGRWMRLACVPVMAFPAVSIAVTVRALMFRYYL